MCLTRDTNVIRYVVRVGVGVVQEPLIDEQLTCVGRQPFARIPADGSHTGRLLQRFDGKTYAFTFLVSCHAVMVLPAIPVRADFMLLLRYGARGIKVSFKSKSAGEERNS